MSSDLTFITNENNRNLLERFKVLIKDTHSFDVLVGYFYTSGFYSLYKSLVKLGSGMHIDLIRTGLIFIIKIWGLACILT